MLLDASFAVLFVLEPDGRPSCAVTQDSLGKSGEAMCSHSLAHDVSPVGLFSSLHSRSHVECIPYMSC